MTSISRSHATAPPDPQINPTMLRKLAIAAIGLLCVSGAAAAKAGQVGV